MFSEEDGFGIISVEGTAGITVRVVGGIARVSCSYRDHVCINIRFIVAHILLYTSMRSMV